MALPLRLTGALYQFATTSLTFTPLRAEGVYSWGEGIDLKELASVRGKPMVESAQILVFNLFPPPTSIYRYAVTLKLALAERSRLVNLIIHKEDRRRASVNDIEGDTVQGFQHGPWAFESFVNYLSEPRVVARTAGNLAQKYGPAPILHFSTPDWKPVKFGGIKVVTIHDNPISLLRTDIYGVSKQFKVMVSRHLQSYGKFYHATVPSHYIAEGLIEAGYGGPITVIPLPISSVFHPLPDPLAARRELGLPTDKKLVLSISTSSPRKNLAMVRSVMQSLGSHYALVRVGPKLGESITFSNLTDEKLNLVYNACDVLLFPSLEEGYGMPPLEASACGLPVVASNIPPIRETLGGIGSLVDPTDRQAFVRAIREEVTSSRRQDPKMLARAREFSMDVFGTRMRDFYEGISNS